MSNQLPLKKQLDLVQTPLRLLSLYPDLAKLNICAPLQFSPRGGPQLPMLEAPLDMMAQVIQSGAYGATIERKIWGNENITGAVKAFKAVIHDGLSAKEALKFAL